MVNAVYVLKDAENQQPVATEWRQTLCEIVEAFKEGDFMLERGVDRVSAVPVDTARISKENIDDYPAQLVSLPEKAWNSSVALWMDGHWNVLIDLYIVQDGRSDLVLDVNVFEDEPSGYLFEVHLVYVP